MQSSNYYISINDNLTVHSHKIICQTHKYKMACFTHTPPSTHARPAHLYTWRTTQPHFLPDVPKHLPVHSPFWGPPMSMTAFNIMVAAMRQSTSLPECCYLLVCSGNSRASCQAATSSPQLVFTFQINFRLRLNPQLKLSSHINASLLTMYRKINLNDCKKHITAPDQLRKPNVT